MIASYPATATLLIDSSGLVFDRYLNCRGSGLCSTASFSTVFLLLLHVRMLMIIFRTLSSASNLKL